MRKLRLIALLQLIACNREKAGPAGSAASPPTAKLSYLDPKCDPSADDCRCTGSLDDPAGLKALGLGPEDLKSGVVCLLGDFDGNGSRDVAIVGRSYDCERSKAAPVRVVLTDHDRILRSLSLPEELGCITPSPLT